MTKAPDLKSASVRIYCDNDTRWELDTDRPNTPEALQNAKQTLPNQWWVDKVNGFRKKGTPQCQRRTLFPNAYTSAITGNTIKSRTNQADDYGLTYDSTMVRPRNVVTLCDLSLLPQAVSCWASPTWVTPLCALTPPQLRVDFPFSLSPKSSPSTSATFWVTWLASSHRW